MPKHIKISLLGPAFIAAIGYIDPGNFATNIQAGSAYGYRLLWVVVWANIIAMFIQFLSAKLGIATHKNLAEHIRDRYPKPLVWFYWIQAELIAIATDLAEFIGAALGFKLLFGLSLLHGMVITAFITLLILHLQRYRGRVLEWIIIVLLASVALAYLIELIYSKPMLSPLINGAIFPELPDRNAIVLAAGILGATIMPHVIYLHSSLTQRGQGSWQERYKATKLDISIAMSIAGFVNCAMLAMAAAVFYFNGQTEIKELDEAYITLSPLLGRAAATIFALSLIAAGLSSTVVGTLAGQVVMQGFVHFNIPVLMRRLITMVPSFLIILLGINTMQILLISQVILSFGIGLALIPLLQFTGDPSLMHKLSNQPLTQAIGRVVTVMIIILNLYLIVDYFYH